MLWFGFILCRLVFCEIANLAPLWTKLNITMCLLILIRSGNALKLTAVKTWLLGDAVPSCRFLSVCWASSSRTYCTHWEPFETEYIYIKTWIFPENEYLPWHVLHVLKAQRITIIAQRVSCLLNTDVCPLNLYSNIKLRATQCDDFLIKYFRQRHTLEVELKQ